MLVVIGTRSPAGVLLAARLFLTAVTACCVAACVTAMGPRDTAAAPTDAAAVHVADNATRPIPHPDVPVGHEITAYTGPRFITGDELLPEAQTVLTDETGRVRALLQGRPPEGRYRVVRLPGALAVPGLHDAHVHLQGIGRGRDDVDLHGSASALEARARITAWADSHPEAAVLHGRGWDQSLFPNARWPSWQDLEGADARGRPMVLTRVDGHAIWINRALLERAGITRSTPDPLGGKILRDTQGNPTGVLLDNAIDLATRTLPPPSAQDEERWLRAGLGAAADAGLTAVHEMGMSARSARMLFRLDAEGRVPLRVFVYLDDTDPHVPALLDERPQSARVKLMGVKIFVDGAMGSRGAALLEDYHDDPGNRGLLLIEPATLDSRIAAIHQRGLAAAVHAIGDRGNRVVLDAMAAHRAPAGVRDRIEHAQLLTEADMARFATLGVVASMQPTHATSDMRWAESRVGPERVKGAYAWRSILATRAILAFGSDSPVEDIRPALGIYAAITRQNAQGQPVAGFLPAQRVSQEEALAAFSAGAAAAVGMESHLGALTPGMFFDVTLFREDVASQPARAWLGATPVGTVVEGALRTAAVP